MAKINVQLLFAEEEYRQLEAEANELGLTVPLYIKAKVLKEDNFGAHYNSLIEKVEALPSGTKFNVKALFGVEWEPISKGVKLNLGKTFYGRVDSGAISNVSKLKKDSSNVMWYEKI